MFQSALKHRRESRCSKPRPATGPATIPAATPVTTPMTEDCAQTQAYARNYERQEARRRSPPLSSQACPLIGLLLVGRDIPLLSSFFLRLYRETGRPTNPQVVLYTKRVMPTKTHFIIVDATFRPICKSCYHFSPPLDKVPPTCLY